MNTVSIERNCDSVSSQTHCTDPLVVGNVEMRACMCSTDGCNGASAASMLTPSTTPAPNTAGISTRTNVIVAVLTATTAVVMLKFLSL